jgi:hypothetical protein
MPLKGSSINPRFFVTSNKIKEGHLQRDKSITLLFSQTKDPPKIKRYNSIRGFPTSYRQRFKSYCGGISTPDNLMNLMKPAHVITEASDNSSSGSSITNVLGSKTKKIENNEIKKSIFFKANTNGNEYFKLI